MFECSTYGGEWTNFASEAETLNKTIIDDNTFNSNYSSQFLSTSPIDESHYFETVHETFVTDYTLINGISSSNIGSTLNLTFSSVIDFPLGVQATRLTTRLETFNRFKNVNGGTTLSTLHLSIFHTIGTLITQTISDIESSTSTSAATSFTYTDRETFTRTINTTRLSYIEEFTTYTYPIPYIGSFYYSSLSNNILEFLSTVGTTTTYAVENFLTQVGITENIVSNTTSTRAITLSTTTAPAHWGDIGLYYITQNNESLIVINGEGLDFSNRFSALSEMPYEFVAASTLFYTAVAANPLTANYVYSMSVSFSPTDAGQTSSISRPQIVNTPTFLDASFSTSSIRFSNVTTSYAYFIETTFFPWETSSLRISSKTSLSSDSFDITDETARFYVGFTPNANTLFDLDFLYRNETYSSLKLDIYPFTKYTSTEGVGAQITPEILSLFKDSEVDLYRVINTTTSAGGTTFQTSNLASNHLFGLTYSLSHNASFSDANNTRVLTQLNVQTYSYSYKTFNGKLLQADDKTYIGSHFYVNEIPGVKIGTNLYESVNIPDFFIYVDDIQILQDETLTNQVINLNLFENVRSFLNADLHKIYLKFTNSNMFEATILNNDSSTTSNYSIEYINQISNSFIYYSSTLFSFATDLPIIHSVYSFGGPNLFSLKEAIACPPAIYEFTTYNVLENSSVSAKSNYTNHFTMECETNQVIKFRVIPKFNFFPVDPELAYSLNKLVLFAHDIEDD